MKKTTKTNLTHPAGDVDDNRVSMPVFTPVLPPRISRTSHSALVQWRKDRREYEETIRNRTKGDTGDLMVSVKSTFDEKLLQLWCRLRWKIDIKDVTDERILDEVDKIISSVKNDRVPDVDREMKEMLRVDLSESDVHERIMQYFVTCHDIIDDHGWHKFFQGENGMKQLCRILIESLEPRTLREDVERTIRFEIPEAKDSEEKLHDVILEKALEQEKDYQRLQRAKRNRSDGNTGESFPRYEGKHAKKQRPDIVPKRSAPSLQRNLRWSGQRLLQRHARIAPRCIGYPNAQLPPTPKKQRFGRKCGLVAI